MSQKTFFKKTGKLPGKTVAIFCGVHGDETAGIKAVDYLRENLEVKAGTVHLVYANPKAIKKKVRFTEANLNRQFIRNKEKDSYESKRAFELMKLLDTCDALLDLHAYTEPSGQAEPFVITESNALEIVKNFEIEKILLGIDDIEKGGSDGYMSNRGKIGICVELGAKETPEKFIELGIKTVYQSLQYFDMVEQRFENNQIEQKLMRAVGMHKRKNEKFSFEDKYKTFSFIKKGTHFCTDGEEKLIAQEDQYLLFPRDNDAIGVEAFISAKAL